MPPAQKQGEFGGFQVDQQFMGKICGVIRRVVDAHTPSGYLI
jgi:hypothetical protein